MTKFIWVRDRDKIEHYVNVDHIIRVTKIPAHGVYSAASFLIIDEGGSSAKTVFLPEEEFDTANDVISKIQGWS